MAGKGADERPKTSDMVRWLFANSRDLFHVVGATGRFELVNPAFLAITGWSEADLIGQRVMDYVHSDDVPEMQAHAARLAEFAISENIARIRARDGSWLWLAGRTQRTPNGRHIVILHEATEERARADEAEDARRSRKLLGARAGIGMWSYEPQVNRIWWSDEFVAMTGLDPEGVQTPQDFELLVHPRDRRRVREAALAAIVGGRASQLEHRLRAHGRWLAVRSTFSTEPQSGGLYSLRGISEDINELAAARDAARRGERQMRRAEKDAQANAHRLKLALAAAEAGVYEIDHVRKTFWASPEFERLTGRIGSSYAEATELRYPGFHPDDVPHVRRALRDLWTGQRKSGEAFEARLIRPDGVQRWVRLHHHVTVSRDGRFLKAVGLIQDCDARKRQQIALTEAQQAAEQATEAKAAFLANMSHEIRTPLNGVMGVLHLLKSETLSAEGRSMLEEALSCGQMLADLLNDVIDFSKIEAGRLDLACEPLDPAALATSVARMLRPQAEAQGLQLIVDADRDLGWVRADPVRLRQALFNLLGNAVKFTERGHVVIRCRRGDAGVLRFEVEDTGVGIPPEAQDRIFQRFDQGDASTTRRFGGSGLGLAITKRLAELMGGAVGFSSTQSVGSTFWLEVAVEPAAAQPQPAAAPDAVLDGVRVLVVEDNATNRLIATKLLEQLGASVETAEDGYLGVEAAARGGFDLILMDVQMPGIDGLEAARRIRGLGAATAGVPIVALTANVLAHQRAAYLEAGMDGVVGKPISPTALLTEIARLSGAAAPNAGASEAA